MGNNDTGLRNLALNVLKKKWDTPWDTPGTPLGHSVRHPLKRCPTVKPRLGHLFLKGITRVTQLSHCPSP